MLRSLFSEDAATIGLCYYYRFLSISKTGSFGISTVSVFDFKV